MALSKTKLSQMPENAVVLTEQQALQFQTQLVNKWPNPSDVFALKYGLYFLGGAALLSGLFINHHFRTKFKLGSYGRISTYLPICLIPATTSMVLHKEMVVGNILLMKDQCPVCLELRSAALQSMIGVVFPLVVAPIGCASLAQRYATINLPYITEKPREVFNLFKKMLRPIKTNVWYLFLAQALMGTIVAYFESKSVIKVHQKLFSDEQQEQEAG